MSEMNSSENKQAQLDNIDAYLQERKAWMVDAVEVVTGSPEGNPLVVFEAAGEVRAEGKALDLSTEQETNLREVAGRFGIGGEADVKSEADHQILEGGKPWKIEAEAAIAAGAKTILFAGSPYRTIGQDEVDYLKIKLPDAVEPATTEYDMARQLAELQDGFQGLGTDDVLPFGYDIQNNHALVTEPTGQFVRIGTLNGADVVMLRVDRENYQDEEGKSKYRNQPDSAALMGVTSEVLAACGDESSSVGMNSSTTYASRAVDTVRAGLKHGREFKVGMYGRHTLAEVRGLEAAEPTDIAQIPGELHTMYTKLAQLEAELHAE